MILHIKYVFVYYYKILIILITIYNVRKISPFTFSRLNVEDLRFSSVQSLSCVRLFATPWTAACQASLSIINPWSLLKLMSIELLMLSSCLILCRPLLLQPSIILSIRVFFSESVLHIRWPKYWSLSFNISPSNEYSGLISFRMDWFDLLAVQVTLNVEGLRTIIKMQKKIIIII